MIVCIQSRLLNHRRFCRRGSAERISARLNSLLALQITLNHSLLWLRSHLRKHPDPLLAAQSLHLSARASVAAARSLAKSP
jgi:hypothetical protein